MMLSEGAKETPSGDRLGERVADGFDVVFIEPTSTPVTQITYDKRRTYVSDTQTGSNAALPRVVYLAEHHGLTRMLRSNCLLQVKKLGMFNSRS